MRQPWKAKKEIRRLVEAGVVGDGEGFHGFQGSGGLALLKRPSGAGGGATASSPSGFSFSLSLSLSIPAIEGRFWAFCLRPSSYSRGRRRRGRSGWSSLRAHKVRERHSNGGTSDSRRNRSSLSRISASASD